VDDFHHPLVKQRGYLVFLSCLLAIHCEGVTLNASLKAFAKIFGLLNQFPQSTVRFSPAIGLFLKRMQRTNSMGLKLTSAWQRQLLQRIKSFYRYFC